MARIFITGSSAGLGQLAAQSLADRGHRVILHARNKQRATDAQKAVPDAEDIVIGDLSSIDDTKGLAEDVNQLGHFDAIIHNAAVYRASGSKILAVNTLAPYILTCLIKIPRRLIYLSSGMHKHGNPDLKHLSLGKGISYSDSKLHVVLLAKAVARRWPGVCANAVDPGWVPTKMGGAGAPDDLQKGFETQVWLAVSNKEEARVSGRYFYHKQESTYHPAADETAVQEKLITACKKLTGVHFPDR